MAKVKNNSPQARINRNNRARGGKFEKTVANILEMFVVPYSGSNARFGWGDVRDTEASNNEGGWWVGECKSMKVEDEQIPVYNIKQEWIRKNDERAGAYGSRPFLAFTRFAKPDKWVMVPKYVGDDLINKGGVTVNIMATMIHKSVHNMVNFRIPESWLKTAGRCRIPTVLETWIEGGTDHRYVMSIEHFKYLINQARMHAKYGGDIGEDSNTE